MAEPLPTTYGPAAWLDFQHNWRKADGDWLQKRSIIRYETTASRPLAASTEPGTVIYNFETDRLEFCKKDATWSGLYVTNGLIIAPDPPPAGADIKMRHPSTVGDLGLVFTSAPLIVTQVPITTSGSEVRMDTTGLTIKTGSKTAKLTTDVTYLRSNAPFLAESLTSTTGLAVGGVSVFTGAVSALSTIAANVYITAPRLLIGAAAPAATNDATRKDYVDGQVGTRVSKGGDVMTNYLLIHQDNSAAGGLCLRARDVSNKPYIDWMDWAGNQLGWIQGTTANLTMYSRGDILLNSGGGQVRTSDAIFTTGGTNRFFSQAHYFVGSGSTCYLGFFGAGSSVDSMGTRWGYIGYSQSGTQYHINEVSGASNYYQCDGAHLWKLSPNGSTSAQVEAMQLHYSAGLMIGKNGNATHTTDGHVFWPNGLTYSTTTRGDAATNYYMNRINGAHGDRWIWFGVTGNWIASVYQNGTSGAVFATTSDYRTKTIISPITDATDRLMSLKPWRVTWNGDPDRGVTDDFVAHEVQDIVPDAVFGEKDAVDEDGNEVHQHMAEYRLMPLTVAALQDTIRRVDALERNLNQLSAA